MPTPARSYGPRQARTRALLDPHHRRRRGPQLFEAIELPLAGAENVHDHVAVVEQHPARGRAALPLAGPHVLGVAKLGDDLALQRFDLALAVPRADDEVVRDGRDGAQVQQEDIAGLPIGGDVDDSLRER